MRLRWVLRDLRHRLGKLDLFATPISVLKALTKHVAQIQGPWNQFRSDPAQHWQQLDNHTDGLLSQMRNLPVDAGGDAWRETFEEVQAEMAEAVREAQKSVESLQASANSTDQRFQDAEGRLAELVQEIQSQKARLDQALTQHSEAFTKAEQERVSQFSQTEQSRLAEFNQAQQERRAQFDSLLDDWRKQANEKLAEHTDRLTQLERESTQQSEKLLSEVQAQLDKAVEIVGTIVNTTMSGNYQDIANREYRNGWIMRSTAIAAFLGMGVMIVWAASSINFGENGVDWTTVAFRISLGAAFLIPGIYCAKEASRHWDAEKHNRRITLELAALDPFLVNLDEPKRKEIIEKKADEYFGRNTVPDDEEGGKMLKEISVRGDQLLKIVEHIAAALRGKS